MSIELNTPDGAGVQIEVAMNTRTAAQRATWLASMWASLDTTQKTAVLAAITPKDSDLSTTDITTNNATTAKHGLLPKLGGGTTNFLRADGTWAAPSGGGGGFTSLTGDVTASGSGAVAATIAAGAVSLSKMANLTAGTILGNNTGSAATPIALTVAQIKTMLGVSLSTDVTGTLQAAQEPAHTGDVTNTAGSLAMTIAANAVDNTKLAQMVTASIKGRTTSGTGNAEDLTVTQVTAMLNAFSSSLKGLVPASGGGTTNFLRADGSWVATGGGTPAGSSTYLQYNNAGAFGGATYAAVENGTLRLEETTTTTATAAGGVQLLARVGAGQSRLAFQRPDGMIRDLQVGIASNHLMWAKGIPGGTVPTVHGMAALSATGASTAANIATTNLYTYTPKCEALITTPSTTAVAGYRQTERLVTIGGPSAGTGGFSCSISWGPATGVATTTARAFAGLGNATGAPTDVEPSSIINIVGMGWDAADTNIQIMTNDGTGTATKTDLGASFPVPTADRASQYELVLASPRGTTQTVYYRVTDLVSGAVATGTISADMPAASSILCPRVWMSAGGTSSVIGVGLTSIYIDPLL